MLVLWGMVSILFFPQAISAQPETSEDFKKTVISRDFISEGITTADMNKDGQLDIVAGYYWFEAPSWKRHQIAPSRVYDPYKEYSKSFLNLGMDVNLDGWDDVVIIGYPGYFIHNSIASSFISNNFIKFSIHITAIFYGNKIFNTI